MSFFQKSSRTGEPFIPAPTQEVPGIQPIVVQAVENLFPGPDDRKRVFDYLTRLGKWSRTYRQPKWRLAFLYYSKGKIENLIEVDSPLLRDPRFIGDEIEPIFPSLQDAEEWVRLITNWRSDGLSHGMLARGSCRMR